MAIGMLVSKSGLRFAKEHHDNQRGADVEPLVLFLGHRCHRSFLPSPNWTIYIYIVSRMPNKRCTHCQTVFPGCEDDGVLPWFHMYTGWWFGICLIFPNIFGIIIPIDELILFRGVGFIPPTSIISIIN